MSSFLPDPTLVDPNMFTMQWDTLFETLALIIILAFAVERVLALFFESSLFLNFHIKRKKEDKGSFKATIAFVLASLICIYWQVDILAVLLSHEHISIAGAIITGFIVAGGSKASIALFRDVLDVKSNAYKKYEEDKKPKTTP